LTPVVYNAKYISSRSISQIYLECPMQRTEFTIARVSGLLLEHRRDGHVKDKRKIHVWREERRNAQKRKGTLGYIFYRAITADPYLRFARLSSSSL